MKESIVLIGGGGHCKSCIEVIEQEGRFDIAGIVDLPAKAGQEILGYPIIGSDSDLVELSRKYDNFLITIGFVDNPNLRVKLFEEVKKLGMSFPVIISPYAHVSKHTCIEEGTIIMHSAVVNADTRIGRNNIINSKALVEHDCIIGDHCHISTGAIINGGCKVGKECFIGSSSVIRNSISVCNCSYIGMGTVVTKDINLPGKYFGNPARKI